MEFDLVIRGGTVVTAADVGKCDVGVKDGRIVALAEDLPRAASEIDASGLLVLPGGIDSHVHFDQPQGPGIVMADGFESGTRSAAAGGNTTVLAFALQPRGQSLRESVESYHEKAKGKCYVDYGFHLIVTDPTPAVLGQELPALVKSGYPSFKVFMTYDNMVLTDRQLLEVFTVAREQGALVMVHAEGYDQIKYMTDRLERDGKTHPYFHAESRPELVEREATHRAISHAELIGIPIMIVHVSVAVRKNVSESEPRPDLILDPRALPPVLVSGLPSAIASAGAQAIDGPGVSDIVRILGPPAKQRDGGVISRCILSDSRVVGRGGNAGCGAFIQIDEADVRADAANRRHRDQRRANTKHPSRATPHFLPPKLRLLHGDY